MKFGPMVAIHFKSILLNVACFLCILMASFFIAQTTCLSRETMNEYQNSVVLFLLVLCLLYRLMFDSIALSIGVALAEALTKIKHESEKTTIKLAASAASVDNAIAKLLLSGLA